MSTALPDGYTIVQLQDRYYPMSYTLKEDGTPLLTACYWTNGTVASYKKRTLAVTYLHQHTEPKPVQKERA